MTITPYLIYLKFYEHSSLSLVNRELRSSGYTNVLMTTEKLNNREQNLTSISTCQ